MKLRDYEAVQLTNSLKIGKIDNKLRLSTNSKGGEGFTLLFFISTMITGYLNFKKHLVLRGVENQNPKHKLTISLQVFRMNKAINR